MTREEQAQLIARLANTNILTEDFSYIVTKLTESRTCEWTIDEDTIYSTSCHNMWEFTESDLTDNEIKFCPYCGSKIVSTDTKGEEDD